MTIYSANGIIPMWAATYILAIYTKYLVLHLHVRSPKFILQFLSKSVVWIIHFLKVRKSDQWSRQLKKNKRIWFFLPHRIKPSMWHMVLSALNSSVNSTHAQKYNNTLHVSRETMPSLCGKKLCHIKQLLTSPSKPGRRYRVAFWLNQSEVLLVKHMLTKNMICCVPFPLLNWILLGTYPLFHVEDSKIMGAEIIPFV